MKLKQASFYLIAITLPFLLLIMIEGALRLCDYGRVYPLFIPTETMGKGYLQPNPNLIKRYFANNATAPKVSPDTFYFRAEKPEGTLRIVSMGGSTMAGFPYGRFGSPAGMLQQRLKASHPERKIEMISVAMSSINSYTLLDIAEEVAAIQPDAVLIYAGHNEYLGVMGVGSIYASNGSHATNLLFLKLKNLRLFQLLQNIYHQWSVDETLQTNEQRTVMAQVAKNKAIVYNDEVYRAGVTQFKQNMASILNQFAEHNIPVYLSNLVANEADQAPFESITNTQLDGATITLKSNQAMSASELTKLKALAIENSHADFMFALAQQEQFKRDYKMAMEYFTLAMDFDLLRFRAPSEFNVIIAEYATMDHVTLVDAYGIMHSNSSPIIGYNLMLEHLHPNHRGYFLIAEAFYQALVSSDLIAPTYDIQRNQAWRLSPLHEVDERYADYKIAQLTSDYPFTDTKQVISMPAVNNTMDEILVNRIQGQSWIATQQALLKHFQQIGEFEKAANVAGLLFDALPKQDHIARVACMLYLRANTYTMALYYAIRASELNQTNIEYKLTLGEIYFRMGNKAKAIEQLDAVLKLQPEHAKARQIKNAIK